MTEYPTAKEYLGDGVYASHDGYHIVLETRTMRIYLDQRVYGALVDFARRVYPSTPESTGGAPNVQDR